MTAVTGGAGPVVIVGLGVLGGSVARGLREAGTRRPIWGVDPDPLAAARALETGAVDRVDPSGDALIGDAEVVVYAAPLAALPGVLAGPMAGGEGVAEGALVTDLVGVNGPVLDRAARAGLATRWVSGTPVIVTPGTGFGASESGLLEGVEIVLSAGDEVETETRRRAEAFWTALGARATWMAARDADVRTAWTWLLPQLVSNALSGALHSAGVPREDLGTEAAAMVAPAATDPERWRELIEAAAPAVGTGLGSVGRALRVVGDLLARREVDRVVAFMERTRGWAAGEDSA
jgi:prephenate dehydrogenase